MSETAIVNDNHKKKKTVVTLDSSQSRTHQLHNVIRRQLLGLVDGKFYRTVMECLYYPYYVCLALYASLNLYAKFKALLIMMEARFQGVFRTLNHLTVHSIGKSIVPQRVVGLIESRFPESVQHSLITLSQFNPIIGCCIGFFMTCAFFPELFIEVPILCSDAPYCDNEVLPETTYNYPISTLGLYLVYASVLATFALKNLYYSILNMVNQQLFELGQLVNVSTSFAAMYKMAFLTSASCLGMLLVSNIVRYYAKYLNPEPIKSRPSIDKQPAKQAQPVKASWLNDAKRLLKQGINQLAPHANVIHSIAFVWGFVCVCGPMAMHNSLWLGLWSTPVINCLPLLGLIWSAGLVLYRSGLMAAQGISRFFKAYLHSPTLMRLFITCGSFLYALGDFCQGTATLSALLWLLFPQISVTNSVLNHMPLIFGGLHGLVSWRKKYLVWNKSHKIYVNQCISSADERREMKKQNPLLTQDINDNTVSMYTSLRYGFNACLAVMAATLGSSGNLWLAVCCAIAYCFAENQKTFLQLLADRKSVKAAQGKQTGQPRALVQDKNGWTINMKAGVNDQVFIRDDQMFNSIMSQFEGLSETNESYSQWMNRIISDVFNTREKINTKIPKKGSTPAGDENSFSRTSWFGRVSGKGQVEVHRANMTLTERCITRGLGLFARSKDEQKVRLANS